MSTPETNIPELELKEEDQGSPQERETPVLQRPGASQEMAAVKGSPEKLAPPISSPEEVFLAEPDTIDPDAGSRPTFNEVALRNAARKSGEMAAVTDQDPAKSGERTIVVGEGTNPDATKEATAQAAAEVLAS